MFNSAYFRKRKYLAWRAPIICSAIKRVFHPTSVVDFGCSIGELVHGFNEIGVPAIGFDCNEDLFDWSEPDAPIILHDITKPLPTRNCFDLGLCMEVLRFIPDSELPELISNFYIHTTRMLIAYGGERKDYVISMMNDMGLTQSKDEINTLKTHLEPWKSKPAIKALYHGGMYFRC